MCVTFGIPSGRVPLAFAQQLPAYLSLLAAPPSISGSPVPVSERCWHASAPCQPCKVVIGFIMFMLENGDLLWIRRVLNSAYDTIKTYRQIELNHNISMISLLIID